MLKDIIVIAILLAICYVLVSYVPWHVVAVIGCLIIVAYRRLQG